MVASSLVDLVKVQVLTTGTGALLLGPAVPSYRGIEALVNGATYSYSIQQNDAFEIGKALYLASSTQLIRSVERSSNGDDPLDLKPNATVAFVALAEDILARDVLQPLYGNGPPLPGQGLIGQVYYDLNNPVTLYGPKTDAGWGDGVVLQGGTGPAMATFSTLSAFKASPISNATQVLQDSSIAFGLFFWETANAPYTADDLTIIKANSTALSVGAWVRQKAREVFSPNDFGADPTGVIDSRAAFNAAASRAGAGGCILVLSGTYLISDQVDILDGQTWQFEGATLYHTDDSKIILRANSISDWSIEGNVTLKGTLVTSGVSGEAGIYVTNGKRYQASGIRAINFKGEGYWIDGSDSGTLRGDRGQWINCSAHENTVARQIDPGSGAEFTVWTNFCASGNIYGDINGAGNTVTIGGNIVDNTHGIMLIAGANDGHGMYVGVNINHNTSENLHAIGVLNGYTFSACHFYGSLAASSQGAIWFDGSKGITITDGTIDCWIYNDLGTGSGANWVIGNYFPGDYGVQLISNNAGLGQLYLSENHAPQGPSDLNDAAPIYAEATRASNQNVAAGATTLVFNNKIKDNRAALSDSTGVFTAPVAGTYEIEALLTFSADSGLVASYVAVILNNATDLGYLPVVPLSGTLAVTSGSVKVTLAAGDTLRLKSTITGVNPLMAQTQSRISIALVG
jgi:hypothetical protein